MTSSDPTSVDPYADIREGIRRICRDFDDEYWAACDSEHRFPWDFYAAVAKAGWEAAE